MAPRLAAEGLPRVLWAYMAAVALIAAGYADFALIAFHFEKTGVVPTAAIPLLYAIAMATGAIAALALGRAFDRIGLWAMMPATLASAAAAPLVFLGGFHAAVVGMGLWGIGMGAQESVMRAQIAAMAPPDRRGTAYGIMNLIYGSAWFGGSALLGVLYDASWRLGLTVAAMALQLAALPILLRLARSPARDGQ